MYDTSYDTPITDNLIRLALEQLKTQIHWQRLGTFTLVKVPFYTACPSFDLELPSQPYF